MENGNFYIQHPNLFCKRRWFFVNVSFSFLKLVLCKKGIIFLIQHYGLWTTFKDYLFSCWLLGFDALFLNRCIFTYEHTHTQIENNTYWCIFVLSWRGKIGDSYTPAKERALWIGYHLYIFYVINWSCMNLLSK